MADARETAEWCRTSHVIAWIQNWSGFAESSVSPAELNPMVPTPDGPEIDAADLALMLCGQKAIDYFAKLDAEQKK